MVTKPEDKKVAVILHFDVWDENEQRLPAAPVVGKNELGAAVREETTEVSPALAKVLVASGKATVPLPE